MSGASYSCWVQRSDVSHLHTLRLRTAATAV